MMTRLGDMLAMKPEITRPQRTRWPHARSIPRRTGSLVGKQQTAVRGAHPINLCLQVPRVNGGCASIVSFEWAGRDRRVWRRRLVRRSDYRKARSSSPTSRWHPYAIDPTVDYSSEPMTLVEFRLEDADGGTLLMIVESGFDRVPLARRAEAFKMNEQGWTEQMRNIDRYVSRP